MTHNRKYYDNETEISEIWEQFKSINFQSWGLSIAPTEFLVEGLIEKSSIIIFYGPPKSAKSLLMVDLMVSLIGSTNWLGKKIPKPALVDYLAFEDANALYMRAICADQHKSSRVEKHRGHCTYAAQPPDIFGSHFEDALAWELDSHGEHGADKKPDDRPNVIIIDTLSLAMAGFGDENSSATMGKVVDKLRRIRNLGITVIVVTHSGKDLSKGIRGHNSLEAAADCIYSVQKKPNSNLVKLKRTHYRNGPAGEIFSFEIKTGVLKNETIQDKKEYLVPYLDYIEVSSGTEKENTLSIPQILVLNSLQRLLKTDPTNVSAMFGLAKDHLAVSYSLLAKDCMHQNIAPNAKSSASKTRAIKRAIESLLDSSLLTEKDGFIWPTRLEQTDQDNTKNS